MLTILRDAAKFIALVSLLFAAWMLLALSFYCLPLTTATAIASCVSIWLCLHSGDDE